MSVGCKKAESQGYKSTSGKSNVASGNATCYFRPFFSLDWSWKEPRNSQSHVKRRTKELDLHVGQ